MQELEEDADMRARINIYKDALGLALVGLVGGGSWVGGGGCQSACVF